MSDSSTYHGPYFSLDPLSDPDSVRLRIPESAAVDGFFTSDHASSGRVVVRLPDFIVSVIDAYRLDTGDLLHWKDAVPAFFREVVQLLHLPSEHRGSISPAAFDSPVFSALVHTYDYRSFPSLEVLVLRPHDTVVASELERLARRPVARLPAFLSGAASRLASADRDRFARSHPSSEAGTFVVESRKLSKLVDLEETIESYLFLLEEAGWMLDSRGQLSHAPAWMELEHLTSYTTPAGPQPAPDVFGLYRAYTVNRLLKLIVALLVASENVRLDPQTATDLAPYDAPTFLSCLLDRPAEYVRRETFVCSHDDPRTAAWTQSHLRPDLDAAVYLNRDRLPPLFSPPAQGPPLSDANSTVLGGPPVKRARSSSGGDPGPSSSSSIPQSRAHTHDRSRRRAPASDAHQRPSRAPPLPPQHHRHPPAGSHDQFRPPPPLFPHPAFPAAGPFQAHTPPSQGSPPLPQGGYYPVSYLEPRPHRA